MKKFYQQQLKEHLLALNNNELKKISFRVLKYIGIGVIDKLIGLQMDNEYFNEPHLDISTDILKVAKSVGVKLYNLTSSRKRIENLEYDN